MLAESSMKITRSHSEDAFGPNFQSSHAWRNMELLDLEPENLLNKDPPDGESLFEIVRRTTVYTPGEWGPCVLPRSGPS